MKQPAKFLFAACLTTMVTMGPNTTAAAESEAPAQVLVQVGNPDQVMTAHWVSLPDAYALRVVFDPSRYTGRIERAREPVANNPITTISEEDMQRLGIINVADALLQLVPQNIGTPMPQLINAGGTPDPDRSQFFIGETIARLRGCSMGVGAQPAPQPTQASYLNQPYPPKNKDYRVDVWLLKADGTQILPATYSCKAEPNPQPRPFSSLEISYQFTIADTAQAVAAAIRINGDFYIGKLQQAGR